MSEDRIPTTLSPTLKAFVAASFASIRELEVLLWLFAHRDGEWTAAQVTHALRSNERATERWLEDFRAKKWVSASAAEPPLYRYHSDDPKIFPLIEELSLHYKIRPLKVIDVIANQPTRRMMDLMHAFKFKRGGDGDHG